MFGEKFLINTDGTNSFGNAVLRRFLQTGVRAIGVFSGKDIVHADICELNRKQPTAACLCRHSVEKSG